MNLDKIIRGILVPATVASLLALSATGAGAQGGATQGSSPSNPDGGGVDKPYAADGQAAGSQDDGHDGNNGPGNDPTMCDDSNGPKTGCVTNPGENIPFAPAFAYPAVAAAAFGAAYATRRLRAQRA